MTWQGVAGTPLPVTHGVEIRLVCSSRHFYNIGGNRAECQNGDVVTPDGDPVCSRVGKNKLDN